MSEDYFRKIRALILQAESTPYEDERRNISARVDELIVKWGVDRTEAFAAAAVKADAITDKPVSRVVEMRRPYSLEQGMLLCSIALGFGARASINKIGRVADDVTLVGFSEELDMIEALWPMLQQQMMSEARHVPAGHPRPRAWRRAFMLAFGDRVQYRLQVLHHQYEEEVEAKYVGTAVVLMDKTALVTAELLRLFPDIRTLDDVEVDAAGRYAGYVAGDRADIGLTRLT